jgi:hypothetical protein
MSVVHVKSNAVADFTGTVTVFNSQGSTGTAAATNLVRPSDWNSAHNFLQTISGNTGGDASTASGTNLVIGATNGASVALATAAGAATLWVDAQSSPIRQYFNPQDGYVQVAGQQGNASMHIQPAYMGAVTFDRLAMPIVVSNSSNSSGTVTISLGVGFYTRDASTLNLVSSTSANQAITFSGTVNNSTFAGMRLFTIPWSSSMSEGQYYVGVWSRTTTGGGNCTVNQFLASQGNSNFSGILGVASNASVQYTRGLGHYSATFSTALPTSVPISQMQGSQSIALRQPVFYLVNGTI